MKRIFVGLVVVGAVAGLGMMPGQSPGRKWTTSERMTRPHLKAAHEDVQKIQAGRVPVEQSAKEWTFLLNTGLHDYRSIMHAHAEDSHHTGGTRPEMLEDAKKAGVSCIMLTDHFRPPHDFIDESWRGLHDGVLFIPGSEDRGYLLYPMKSIMSKMKAPEDEFPGIVTEGGGLIFLSHVEERTTHSMAGLTGMEIYNRHADANDDMIALFSLLPAMTDMAKMKAVQEDVQNYHAEFLGSQQDYLQVYMNKWDAESQKQRVTGVAANDCHHNMVIVEKMADENSVLIGLKVDDDKQKRKLTADQYPSIKEMTKGHKAGDELAKFDLDPYVFSFHDVSTHILAPELTEQAIRDALRASHNYVSHDWMCDPTGFMCAVVAETDNKVDGAAKPAGIMGDEFPYSAGQHLVAALPVKAQVKVIKNGKVVFEDTADKLNYALDGPGVYRVEAWLKVDTEDRAWIYANPFYVK